MKNKKLILIIAIILIVVLIVGIIVRNKRNSLLNTGKTISLDEVFNIENIENISNKDIKIEKAKDIKVSSRYTVGSNSYVATNKVKFNERDGKIIFLRASYNKSNIYQTSYYIDKDGSLSEQIGNRMYNFIEACTSYVGISPEDKYTEMFLGNSTDDNLPTEERIYINNETYCRTYEIKDHYESEENEVSYVDTEESKKYDLNFFMSGDWLICEFVNIL